MTAAALYGSSTGLGASGSTADMLGSVYDAAKDYQHQAYTSAHQYYNSMQQAYGATSPSSYMNSSFYNTSSYGYAAAAAVSLGSSTSSTSPLPNNLSSRPPALNPSCKASTASYLGGYTTPGSPFGGTSSVPTGVSTHQSSSSSYGGSYAGYNCAASTSGFAQAFPTQGVDYGGYGTSYAEAQTVAQYPSSAYYSTQSYSPYVSSPSSSGSISTSYQLAATSLPGKKNQLNFHFALLISAQI